MSLGSQIFCSKHSTYPQVSHWQRLHFFFALSLELLGIWVLGQAIKIQQVGHKQDVFKEGRRILLYTYRIYQLYRVSSTCFWSWLGSKAVKKRKSKALGWNKQNNPCHRKRQETGSESELPCHDKVNPSLKSVSTGTLHSSSQLLQRISRWCEGMASSTRLDTFSSEVSGFPPQDYGRYVVMLYL